MEGPSVKGDDELGDWTLKHPKCQEMLSFGFDNLEQVKLAMLIYLDLTEEKHWWHVNVHPCPELKMVVLSGKQSRNEPKELVFPLARTTQLSIEDMKEFTKHIKHPDVTDSGVTLAIIESDSTIMYGKICDGIVPPDPPEMIELKTRKRKKKLVKRKQKRLMTERQIEFLKKKLKQS